ncbi:hypothetical protein ASD24_10175 [Paenibacillus sp. Root52]|uniref:class I SAM-dependent methyltransferase n=1 Tax=Paenibacillus sp. Root52 TaxID=1736552 RepID=UPI0006FCB43D|nr:class I SAM-dependent methyltransferase [Paenibacillus sp. Root52]KQY84141.1 hypothetical protein ASD24_10175 [Paenibacillus sp. Root52]
METLKSKLVQYKAGHILEVGTGTGKFIPMMMNIFNGIDQIVGIDMDHDALLEAKNTYIENTKIKFVAMNAEQLSYEDHTFNTVCISNALHHMPPESKVLEEMKRVLKSEGLFLINELFCDGQNEAQLSHVMYHHFSAEIDRRLGIYHHQTYTKQDILDLIRDKGIGLEIVHEYNESKGNVRAEQDIVLVTEACRKHIERTKDFSDYIEFKRRGEEIIERLNTVGIQRPTQLMVLGKVEA